MGSFVEPGVALSKRRFQNLEEPDIANALHGKSKSRTATEVFFTAAGFGVKGEKQKWAIQNALVG